MDSREKAVLRTLLYSNLFHFPLTKKEIWQYLHAESSQTKHILYQTLTRLVKKKKIATRDDYYCLRGEEHILQERKMSEQYFQKKLARGKHVALILSCIPTILFIGISGSVAAGQADKAADIDFFIITKKDTVWITRLITFMLLSFMHIRRTKEMETAPGKICLNYFIDETVLSYPLEAQDIYTAREIAQLKPLYNKSHTYELFLTSNNWVKKHLPHTKTTFSTISVTEWSTSKQSIFIAKIEQFVFQLQQYYMTGKQVSSSDNIHRITFYNTRFKQRIIGQFEAKLKGYSLLTK